MSISIEAAERELYLLKKVQDNPELILTGLLPSRDVVNFLYQINVDGEYARDYLEKHVVNIPVFDGLIVKYYHDYIKVYVKRLSPEDLSDRPVSNTDIIAKIQMCDKTYKIIDNELNRYNEFIQRKIKFIPTKLADYWEKFDDLSFKSRIKKAFKSLKSNKKPFVRIEDFLFWIFMSNKKKETITKLYNREVEHINNVNEYEKGRYERDVTLQNFYKEFAEEHIKNANKKQTKIEEYLNSLGYKRVPAMEYDV